MESLYIFNALSNDFLSWAAVCSSPSIMLVLTGAAILFFFSICVITVTVIIIRKTSKTGLKLMIGCGVAILLAIVTAAVAAGLFFLSKSRQSEDKNTNNINQQPTTGKSTYMLTSPPNIPSPSSQHSSSTITPMTLIDSNPFLLEAQDAVRRNDQKAFMDAASKARESAISSPKSFLSQMVFGRIMLLVQKSPNSNILAERHLRKAHELEPTNIEATKFLIGACGKMKKYNEVIKLMEMPAERGEILEPALIAVLTNAYYYTRQHKRGLLFLKKLTNKHPGRFDIRFQHANLAGYSGNKQEAVNDLQYIIRNPAATAKMKLEAQKFMNKLDHLK